MGMTNGTSNVSGATGAGGCMNFNKNYLYIIGVVVMIIIAYMWGLKSGKDKKSTTTDTNANADDNADDNADADADQCQPSKKSTAVSKKSTAASKKSTATSKKSTAVAKKSTAASKKSTAVAKKPSTVDLE